MATDTGSMSYVATKACGCVSLAAVDVPKVMKEAAKDIARCIRLGDTVNRMTSEQVRRTPWKCAEHQAQANRQRDQGKLFQEPKQPADERKRRERRIDRLQEKIDGHQKKIQELESEMEEETATEGRSR